MKKKRKLFKWIGITIIGIGLNLAGRILAESFNMPIWLDAVGTCLAAYFAGPLSGLVTGITLHLFLGFMDKLSIVYVMEGIVCALAVSFCVKKKYLERFSTAAIGSFWIGVLTAVIVTPLNMILYDGYAGNMWGDTLIDMLDWFGMPRVLCAAAGAGIVEVVNKQVCILAAALVIFLIRRMKSRKEIYKKKKQLKAFAMLMAGEILLSFCIPALEVHATETLENSAYNYFGTVYNNSTGLMSSEANVIAETDDGCIWIGSYAGLTRYDGKDFEFISEGGIVNVTHMLNDSKGRLWIGTNDNGIARYENGTFTFFKAEDGLPGNSIRSFAEAADGSVYVGTTDNICKFGPDDKVTVLDLDMKYVISMEQVEDVLLCVDNNGNMYAIKEDKLVAAQYAEESGIFCNFVEATTRGVLVGTSDAYLYKLHLTGFAMKLEKMKSKVLEEVVGITEGRNGRIWICAEAGFGFLDKNGKFYEQHHDGFDYSFEWIYEDYQGNIWLTSSRYGVLKMSGSQFVNLFARAGEMSTVVNAVVQYQGDYYCGTDSGLVILDGKDFSGIEDSLTEFLQGERIRCLMVDSENRLWICGYGTKGLLRYEPSGELESYTMESKAATSDRFRCILEMRDGTIVAGTADGINFIEEDRITDRITSADGLRNSQILTLTESADGVLYAGTDGGGIYAIKDRKIIANDSVQNGLTSDVVLRMIPYDDGFFVVTSNSLCYKKGDSITALQEFPYFNNYDVIIRGEQAYVFSSAGIYIVNAQELARGQVLGYQLLNYKEGLAEGLTANSWNCIDDKGNIFFCSNSGVIELLEQEASEENEFKFGMMQVTCDGKEISCQDETYTIPKNGKRITLQASIKNYALQDVKVRFFIQGMDIVPQVVSYQEMEPINLSNLASGRYLVNVQIMDDSGENVQQEKVYKLNKEAQVWENVWYKVYLAVIFIEFIVFTTWTVLIMVSITRRRRELEVLRLELENKVGAQMSEINVQKEKMENMLLSTVEALSEVVDAKDRYTSGHSKRVALYARMIAERLGKSKEECQQIYYAGLLHDIGKIRIPEDIINKPDKLIEDEYEIIKVHSVTGYHILKGISENMSLALGAKFHHERYDGNGYPNGLQGEDIPEVARIIGVADAYDAMTSNRSYRKTLPQEKVHDELIKGRGVQFDPVMTDIMLQMMEEDKNYTMKQHDILERNILIVDDEEKDIETIREIMQDEPMYTLYAVSDSREALEVLKENRIDLLLIDIELSGMNGYEALKELRAQTAASVVFMTVDKKQETIQRVFEMGAVDYLTKPFLPLVFKEILHSVLYKL